MLRTFTFLEGETLEFEDSRSVRELIAAVFEKYDYYEPLGMETVTVFQSLHSSGSTGWFTTNPDRSCAEEIENPKGLCFACSLPGVFYYAEGGWGSSMMGLGNHPVLESPVQLHLRAPEFDHTLVMAGTKSLRQILELLQQADYLPEAASLMVRAINPWQPPFEIAFSDPKLDLPLTELEGLLPEAVTILCIGE